MDPPAWERFRFVLIIPRILRNCVSRGLTGSVGSGALLELGLSRAWRDERLKIINEIFSNSCEVERGEKRQWRAGGASGRPQAFISVKELFTSIHLDSGKKSAFF